jgi:GT2 family glycosyltransferase
MTTILKSLRAAIRQQDMVVRPRDVPALVKKRWLITKVKARKRARSRSPYVYTDSPTVSLIIQSFNHRENIERIVRSLRPTAVDEFIVCEDGSADGSDKVWRQHLTRPNDFLIQSNDLHEIRTYNRAIGLARGEFIGLLQDDDIPPEDPNWVADAVKLFRTFPKIAVLGCWNGWRLDLQDVERSIGSAVGPGVAFDESGRDIALMEPNSGLPFTFVDAVGIGPLFVRRADFEALGGFDLRLSGPGEPGIWLDYELCLRAWLSGRHVGVYESAAFERNVGGQGTMMFTGSKRVDNYVKNFRYVKGTYGDQIDSIRSLIEELNRGLVGRPDSLVES